jgi:hypothetical protein
MIHFSLNRTYFSNALGHTFIHDKSDDVLKALLLILHEYQIMRMKCKNKSSIFILNILTSFF